MVDPRSAWLVLLLVTLGLHSVLATRLSDVSALLALKSGWGNPISLSTWVNDPCTSGWLGVTCTPSLVDTVVTALALPGLGLVGPISTQIGNLTGLTLLNLGGNPITGTLPSELGNLVNLQYLYINSTQVTGPVPQGFGRLPLIQLRLDANRLSGPLPYDLTNLTQVQTMQFNDNDFNGSIPYQFGGLPALEGLFMQNNNFSGQLPNSFAQSPFLEILALYNNSLQGNLPQEFGSLANLRGLYLQNNQLTGAIPDALGNCKALVELFLSSNQMTGPIPAGVMDLPLLTNFVLSNNQFSGTLPALPGPDLQNLLVDNNTLTGPIPSTYSAIPNFRYTPNDFCSYTVGFDCQGGGCLRTPGPQCTAQAPAPAPLPVAQAPALANTTALFNASVLWNTTNITNTTSTTTPLLTTAPLAVAPSLSPTSTPTPSSTPSATCPPGQQLSNLSGAPLCVSPVQASFKLADKNLSDWTPSFQTSFVNDLAGQIGLSPQQIIITRVAQGSILVNTDFVPLTGTALDNQTVTTIQDKLGGNDTPLNLNNNMYGNVFVTQLVSPATGGIGTTAPTAVAPNKSGGSSLSTGALVGIIMASVVFLVAVAMLAYLLLTWKSHRRSKKGRTRGSDHEKGEPYDPVYGNAVYNNAGRKQSPTAQAAAPAPAYSSRTAEWVKATEPLPPPSEPPTPPAAATPLSARSSSTKFLSPRGETAPMLETALVPPPPSSPLLSPPPGRNAGRTASLKSPPAPITPPEVVAPPVKKSPSFFSRKKKEEKRSPSPTALDLGPSKADGVQSQLVADIAARNFSLHELQTATNNFARGNMVGEGGLGRVYRAGMEDKEFAVKRLDPRIGENEVQFLREVAVLAELHHGHVVELVGYCSEGRDRLLVHEFVPNRTLQDHLHGDKDTGRRPGTPITWNARMKIALGMARGLEYLHGASVVHGCFKTVNVLLDHELVPKVSDAAMPRFFPQGADKQMSSQMLGTFAYAAPEFSMTGEYTVKGDVYSFGVVLLELMTGRKPLDAARPRQEQSLVRWAMPMLHSLERLEEMVDPELEGIYPAKSLLKFAQIVSECVQPEAEFRPAMAEVVEQLQTHLVPFASFNARSLRRGGSQSIMTPPPGTRGSPMPGYSARPRSQSPLASPRRRASPLPLYTRDPSYYDYNEEDED